METKRALEILASYVPWVQSLKEMSEETWHSPIGEEKWSTAEIIAHMMFWDRFLSEHALISVKKGEPVRFPDIQRVNDEASVHAMNGIAKDDLLDEAVTAREQLVAAYQTFPDEDFDKNISVITGEQRTDHFTLLYLIDDFIQHDNHHKQQIVEFLKSRGTSSEKS